MNSFVAERRQREQLGLAMPQRYMLQGSDSHRKSASTMGWASADRNAFQVGSIDVPVPGSGWFDIPGPDILSGREILERTAEVLGASRPLMIQVPFVSPRLSSHWVRFVTRAEWSVAREVVVGLKDDLLAKDDLFWKLVGRAPLIRFEEAARRALAAERAEGPVPGACHPSGCSE